MKIDTGWELESNEDLMLYEHIHEYKYPDSRFYRKDKEAFALKRDGREYEPYTIKRAGLH